MKEIVLWGTIWAVLVVATILIVSEVADLRMQTECREHSGEVVKLQRGTFCIRDEKVIQSW